MPAGERVHTQAGPSALPPQAGHQSSGGSPALPAGPGPQSSGGSPALPTGPGPAAVRLPPTAVPNPLAQLPLLTR
jgi:hypothetical protein